MSDANTTQSVECPICGESFDPAVAGGWCTNTECGEWQYTDTDGSEKDLAQSSGEEPDDDSLLSPTDAPESEPFDDEGDSDEQTENDAEEAVDTGDESENVADGDDESEPEAEEQAQKAVDTEEETVETDEQQDEETATDASETDEQTEEDAQRAVESDGETASDDRSVDERDEAAPDAPADDVEESAGEAAESINCPDCNAELAADANFCVQCGADVSAAESTASLDACPSCGTDITPEDSFCVSCGEDLDAHREEPAEDPVDTGDGMDETPADAVDALEANSQESSLQDSLVLKVAGQEIDVENGDTVGREIRAALMDAGRAEDEAVRVHREHVRFIRETDGFYLLDMGDNPTRLNGKTLTKGDRKLIEAGDEIELSGVVTATVLAD